MRNKLLFFEYLSHYLNIYSLKQTGKSVNTVESYRDNFTIFRKFILEKKNKGIRQFYMDDCSKELILEYIEYLKSKGRTASTINHHISAIKGYIFYVSDLNIKFQGLALAISHIPSLKKTTIERMCLDDKSLKLMFEMPKKNKIGMRNLTIMILLYETAMRVSELINLKKNNLFLNVSTPYCLVHGKGDKERIVGLSSLAISHIINYINYFHKNNECDYLFYTTIKGKSDKLCTSTIETFIQKYANEARKIYDQLPKKVYPHMFRRSRATHLYRDGVPLELVSRILGHSQIETTKIYAKPSMEMIRDALKSNDDSSIKPEWNDEDEVARLFGIR